MFQDPDANTHGAQMLFYQPRRDAAARTLGRRPSARPRDHLANREAPRWRNGYISPDKPESSTSQGRESAQEVPAGYLWRHSPRARRDRSPRGRGNRNLRSHRRGSSEIWRPASRPLAEREGNRIFYVVSEGEATETDYLGGLDTTYGQDLNFVIRMPSRSIRRDGLSPPQVVGEAAQAATVTASSWASPTSSGTGSPSASSPAM